MHMDILYRDDRVIVCVKPAGVLSTDEPGGLPELIRAELGKPDAVVRSTHRLDRTVGGIMVFARTRRAASELSAQHADGRFQKEYLAVVRGIPEPLQGEMRDMLKRDFAERKTYVAPKDDPETKVGILRYEVLASLDEITMLRICLLTGRTHQIRCQLSARGMPIVGDVKYGAPRTDEPLALWSERISFEHPKTGERMSFHVPPPEREPWTRFTGA